MCIRTRVLLQVIFPSTLFISLFHSDIQDVPERNFNILRGHSIGHSKQKNCICTGVLLRTVSEIELPGC